MKLRSVAWNIVTAVALAAWCNPPAEWYLPVTLRGQETPSWCWAASGEMIMEYMGAHIEQCDEANKQFTDQSGNPRTDCCNKPVPWQCIDGGWPEFGKYGFTSSRISDEALKWKKVKSQIYCEKKPFAFSWKFNGGGGHMMVAIGYAMYEGTSWVYVNNPEPWGVGNTEWITYESYVSGSYYSHWDDFYDVTKN
jgi:hypothetical protein